MEELSKTPLSPWDHWLRFRDPALEHKFLARMANVWTNADYIFSIFCLSHVPPKLIGGNPKHPILFYATILFLGVIQPTYSLVQIQRHREFYKKNRTLVNGIIRCLSGLLCVLMLYSEHVWVPDPRRLAIRFVTHTPLLSVAIAPIGYRIPFTRHLAVQLVAVSLAGGWIWQLCDQCARDAALASAVSAFGCETEACMGKVTTLGLSEPPEPLLEGVYACWVVGGFFHVVIGFMLPSVFVYLTECSTRSTFLASLCRRNGGEADFVREVMKANAIFSALVVFVGVPSVWYIFSAIAAMLQASARLQCPAAL